MERIWGNWEEMKREWWNGTQDRMRARKKFISVFPSLCCKTLTFFTFCHKTLKFVTFSCEMLKYGTFCRECRKNRNIRAMRKWFWIKSGCEESPQVVPACLQPMQCNAMQCNASVCQIRSLCKLHHQMTKFITHASCWIWSNCCGPIPVY